MKLRIIPCIIM